MLVIVEQAPSGYEGIVRVRELPQEINTDKKYLAYWKKLTSRERDKFTVYESRNLITSIGLSAISAYLGSWTSVPGFGKYLALGIGALSGPTLGDTSLVSEYWRKQPSILTVVGAASDLSVFLLATDAQTILTEAGLFTGSATSTPGSGSLATHLSFNVNNAVGLSRSIDYRLSRN